MKFSYICPFCFSEHKIGDVDFACEQRKICGEEQDAQLSKYTGNKSYLGPHTFRLPKASVLSMPKMADCDKCHQTSHTRICPTCHNQLPVTIESDEDTIVALIGTRGSGKSTYIGVLIHEMMKRLFRPFNGTFQLYGAEDSHQYRERFENDLYKNHRPIAQTQSHLVGNTITENRPILGTVKLQTQGFMKRIKAMTVVFFDSAGEDWENQDTINVVARYIAHAAGIIFLIDPLANAVMRNNIDNEDAIKTSIGAETNTVSEPAEVLNRAADLIRKQRNMKITAKIDIPVAVAFSKLDVLEDLNVLPQGSALAQPSPHVQLGKFDDNDQQMINQEMRGLLSTWDQGDFLQALDLNYSNNACFAFSALGRAPEQDGSIAPPIPNRIEDAMFWILHKRGIL